jgi:hypothetical protein
MSETEEVTILIDLDRMPRNIGYVRDHDAGRGNYNRRVFSQSDYEDIYNWVFEKVDSVNGYCNVQILGTLPTFLMGKLCIDLSEDENVCAISQGKPGDCPGHIWDMEHGTFRCD